MAAAAGSLVSPSLKNTRASETGRSSTSVMSLPPSLYSSTAAWKRLPPQSSHGVSMVSMNPSSVMMTPAPLQVGQAPSEFALNRAGFTPFAFAKALRMGSSSPV